MITCPAVHTGETFLSGALTYIDCQARTIGAYGFAALSGPGSPASLALTGLLTIFVALFGIRLLLDHPMASRDVVGDILKVAIVLTLATSWPAWRVVGYDLLIDGPGQVAQVIGAGTGLPGSDGDLVSRLQNVDAALAALNAVGSGRLGVAQGDWFQLGFARSAWLAGTLGPIAIVRLTAGFLLALAPLMAGLLLFGITRSLFEGWARTLAAAFIASAMLAVVQGVELALLEPWLQDALQRRAADSQILDAPVEILVVTLSFAIVSLGALFVSARLAFHVSAPGQVLQLRRSDTSHPAAAGTQAVPVAGVQEPARAAGVVHAISGSFRREERIAQIGRGEGRRTDRAGPEAPAAGPATASDNGGSGALGSSWRRQAPRSSGAARRRDGM